MSVLKSAMSRLPMLGMVAGFALLTGCLAAEPATLSPDVPVAAAQSEIGADASAGVAANTNQVADRQGLAEYQLHLGDADLDLVTEPKTVAGEAGSDQITDRQALAEYQLHLGDTGSGRVAAGELGISPAMPGQIADQQALAEYQSNLGNGRLAGQ